MELTSGADAPTRPELLAPAGNWECARAAIENGADAVYFGLEDGFNARARADNFSLADLPELMELLHGRGVRGYLTLNTLIFSGELPRVERVIKQVAAAGTDAVLVQDLGLMRLIRDICPELSVHASTQATMTSAECIREIQSLGVDRVVLARELSVKEIRAIRRECATPVEVFVHGALCVAYSGQCLTSESLGGRSANRGQCAQACRLPYELVSDGQDVPLGDQQYLLSPQDLAAYDLLPELIAAGVCSLKIEGRLKTPEYVANITSHYRDAIETALAGRAVEMSAVDVQEMELSFSRGFSHGWLAGCDHKALVPALSSAKRGVLLGEVLGSRRGRVEVRLCGPVRRGEGIVFAGNRAADAEQGGRVYEIFQAGRPVAESAAGEVVELALRHGTIDFAQLSPGQDVWKTDDPVLNARLRGTFTSPDPLRRLPLAVHVSATVGNPPKVHARIAGGPECTLLGEQPLEAARKHPLTLDLLRQQFSRLGGTPFELGELTAEIQGEPMLPLSLLGQLRHALVRQLQSALTKPPTRTVATDSPLARWRAELVERAGGQPERPVPAVSDAPQLRLLCRSLGQLREVLDLGVRHVYCDFQDIRDYKQAVQAAHAVKGEILLATPRIQKPGERGIFMALARHGADGMLVRNLAGLAFYQQAGLPVVADFSLNAANELTCDLLRSWGAVRVTPSYDLNRDQLAELVANVPVAWLEVVIHQHMPMFHMEHCVFCAVLSPGTNKHNCGRPCDRHTVELRDRVGMQHPLTADVGCRNTLFNAVAQSAAEATPQLLREGIRSFRVELLHDHGAQLGRLIHLYQDLLAGNIPARDVWSQLQATNRVGVTRGTLEERRNPLAIL